MMEGVLCHQTLCLTESCGRYEAGGGFAQMKKKSHVLVAVVAEKVCTEHTLHRTWPHGRHGGALFIICRAASEVHSMERAHSACVPDEQSTSGVVLDFLVGVLCVVASWWYA